MPGWHRCGVPCVDRTAGRRRSRFGADREAGTAHRIPLISVQNGTPLLPGRPAQSGLGAARGNRAADRNLRTPVDVPAARNVRRECPALVGAADPRRRRCRALAHGAAPTAPIHKRDIAAVAIRALCEDGHAGAEYVLTGPQSLSQFEQISTIGDVIGRSLRLEEISPEDARHELLTVIPALAVNMLLGAWAAAIGQPAFVTSTVAEITGAPARRFRDWAADHLAEFRA